MQVLLLNGPNLNLLGTREPAVYGSTTLREIEEIVRATLERYGFTLRAVQSNHEGALLDAVHLAASDGIAGAIVNAGAYTHTSIALRDALLGTAMPFVEVHLSNVFAREAFRHHSYLSDIALGVICGCGPSGYRFAAEQLAETLNRTLEQGRRRE